MNCKDCQYAKKVSVANNCSNWFCNFKGNTMIIDITVQDTVKEINPSWCPLRANSDNKSEENKFKSKRKYMTTLEKKAILEKFKPKVEWEDIKVNEVYHVPPLLFDDRKDIIILSKSDYSCCYKILSNNPQKVQSIPYTLYKTSLMRNFLVKDMLRDIKVALKKNN